MKKKKLTNEEIREQLIQIWKVIITLSEIQMDILDGKCGNDKY